MKEVRNSNNEITPILPNSREVSGYAIVFNSDSNDLGGFIERIQPEALEGVIEKSDVLCLLNHNEDKGVLARSKHGEGSLRLEIDEIGLKYTFEAPNTALGDELLEGLRRGDINTSSFAFTVGSDNWSKREDGTYLRTINSISELFDVSPVYRAAYDATSVKVDARGLDTLKQQELAEAEKEKFEALLERSKQMEEKLKEEEEKPTDEDEPTDEAPTDKQDEEPTENPKDDEEQKANDESTKEDDKEDEEDNNTLNDNKLNKRKMEKFSLLKAINSVVNNQPLDERAQEVVSAGLAEMRKAGLGVSGQIQLPIEERADVQATVATSGLEAVATDKFSLLEPLRANLVMAQAGANLMTGLVGNISIPAYSGATVGWAGEIEAAADGAGTFSEIELSPKRLTAYIDVSKQFLIQDSVNAEEMLRNDIVRAISDKLEATILGDEAGTTKKPAGIFNGASAADLTYEGTVDMEEAIESANVMGELTYIVSPKAKAALRKATKTDNGFTYENGEVNGIKVLSTSNCKGVVLGNFSDYVIAQWAGVDLVIDGVSQAINGKVRIVVNAYFDAKPRRSEAFVAGVVE